MHHTTLIRCSLLLTIFGSLSLRADEQPLAVEVYPTTIVLHGPRAGQQVLVTARFADGRRQDLTRSAQWSATNPQLVEIGANGWLESRANGKTMLQISAAGRSLSVPVTVVDVEKHQAISFRREFMPVLSSAGCSDIRCHGAPSGKNGFRLSLWGFDPQLDHQQLTRAGWGRRTNSLSPDQSLILLKALGRVPHVGRQRFKTNSSSAKVFREWQSQGLRDDPDSPRLVKLSVEPGSRVLHAPAISQQLAVKAGFANGDQRDITRLTTFSSTDLGIAIVNREGLVEFKRQGEVAILCRFQGQLTSVRLMHIATPPAHYRWPQPPANNYVDRHVFNKLQMLSISPSELCSDEQFVRRVFLDLCGVLPTPEETREFVESRRKDKRVQLVDRLLQRPEYADFWTKKWMDLLRASRDSIQLAGSQAYQQWMRERIEKDAPLSRIARELLTSQGKSYEDPAANFYCATPIPKEVSDPLYLQKDLAEATAQLFLGVRLQCAQCHNHPYEKWTQNDYLSLAAFFTQIKRTRLGKAGPSGRPDRRQMAIAINAKAKELRNTATGTSVLPRLPGNSDQLKPEQDRRQALANWLTASDNPFFAKAVANRVWFHLLGRGIVEPVDDFRDSNPAANDALLNALANNLVRDGFRLKPLIRAIVTSRTYQLSATPNTSNRKDSRYFSHRFARPLPAEVLLDAICDVTDVPEQFEITKDYTIGIPQGSVKLPLGTRAVQLPVTDIMTLINTSGKYVRYEAHPFLRTFGQPNRTQTCECDREQNFSRKQALELIVGPLVSKKIAARNNRLHRLLDNDAKTSDMLRELYLRALSRLPSPAAEQSLTKYVESSNDRRQAWEDILWTILNSQEFIYQH